MSGFLKKSVLAATLAATALTSATPALADDYRYRRHHDNGGDTAAAAVVGGIVGLALGAIIASSGRNKHDRDRRYRDGNHNNGGYYDRSGWQWRDGYYWDRDGRRYDRDGRPCDDDRGYRSQGGYYDNGGYYNGGYNRGY